MKTYALTFLVALSLAAPAGANPPVAPAESQAIAVPSNIQIDNFGRVSGNYFRGAQPKGQDFANLAGIGVKLVIDLAKEGDLNERANVEREGMKFLRIPMTTDVRPAQADIDKFLKLVNDPANQPVYVHCMGGKHRTGVMTAAYRMTHDSWTADQAFSEMKKYKFGSDFLHPALKSFVYSFYSDVTKAQPRVLLATSTPAVP